MVSTERESTLNIHNLVPACTENDRAGIRTYFGYKGIETFNALARGERLSDYSQRVVEINSYFHNALADIYRVRMEQASDLYRSGTDKANVLMRNFSTGLLVEQKEMFGLRTEIQRKLSPFDQVAVLAGVLEGEFDLPVDDRLRFQVKRQLLLAHTFAQIDARKLRQTFNRSHTMLIGALDRGLFVPMNGKQTINIDLQTKHDNKTNTFISEDAVAERPVGSYHTKIHYVESRFIPNMGYVIFDSREKDDESAVLKALSKAEKNGGGLNPCEDVQDQHGVKIVLLEFGSNIQKEVATTLSGRVYDSITKQISVDRIEQDDDTNGDRNQSKRVKFTRLQVYSPWSETPNEVLLQGGEDYFNSDLEVGEFNPETHMYTGGAHELYEINRLLDVSGEPGLLGRLYHPDIYDHGKLMSVTHRRMHKTADDLLYRKRIQPS